MIDTIIDGLLDTLKLMPYLFLAFIILEFIEHKLSKKNAKILAKSKRIGPAIGGLLGAIPQCGFSTMAANLFSSRIISLGTLIAIFLSTSDEMLPIMISKKANLTIIFRLIGLKAVIGIVIGLVIDILSHCQEKQAVIEINHICEEEHCECNHKGIIYSSIKHTLKIAFFILIVNIALNLIIFKIGESNLSRLLLGKNIFAYFLASLVGLIPNCASSVILTELYLQKMITTGNLLAGLLTGSGLGILVLFKTNKNIKENIKILSIIYFIGVVIGFLIDFII